MQERRYLNAVIIVIGLSITLSFVGLDLRFLPFYKLYSQVYVFITSYLSSFVLTFVGIWITGFGILNYLDLRTWIKIMLSMVISVLLTYSLILVAIFVL